MSLTELDFSLFMPKTNITITTNLAETAARIAINHFEWRYMTLVLFNSTILNVVGEFWHLYDKSFILTKGLHRPRYNPEVTRQYIVFGKDISDITRMLDWMQGYKFDNTGKYVVICQSSIKCDETEAVATFWYHKVTNVVFLKQVDEIVSGYTYFYSADNCAMSAPVKIEALDRCLDLADVDDDCDLFPAKFYDLFGCPLIASTFRQPPYMFLLEDGRVQGSDGDLLVIIAEALNATLKMMTPYYGDGWGTLNEDDQWLGSLGDIYYDLANISITSAAITTQRYKDFQLSFSYNVAQIGWITSATQLESASLKLLHPFQPDTHAAVGVTYLIVIVTAIVIKSNIFHELNKIIGISPRNSMIFYTWVIFMGLPMSRLPKKPFLLYMIFLWIWYAFFIRTIYQASLMHSLKSNKFQSNFETVEELMDAKYKVGGGTGLQDYFNDYPAVYNSYVGLNASEVNETKVRISQGENFGLAVNLEAAHIFLQTYGGDFHILEQKIVVSPTVIYFKKFSPLARAVNRILWRLVESGIPDKLYRIYVTINKKAPKRVNNKDPITMNHYTGCYALLFCGWILSFLSFLCELLLSKNKHRL